MPRPRQVPGIAVALCGGLLCGSALGLPSTAIQIGAIGQAQPAAALPEGRLTFGAFIAEFDPDGGFRIDGEGWPPMAGTWEVHGTELRLISPDAPDGCSDVGLYAFQARSGSLTLSVTSDDCNPRRMILDRSTWHPQGSVPSIALRQIIRTASDTLASLPGVADSSGSWPSFRGAAASGSSDGQNLPDQWDVDAGDGVLWRTPLPGLAHSSPVVWGDRVFVTSALGSLPDATFRPGLYGDGDASEDRSLHRWMVYAYDKSSGRLLWERTAHEGHPVDKRHIKSTYASATPATDGRIVVAAFGSQGVHAFDVDGAFLWKVDFGHLDLGAYDVPTYEWGPASSPILWNDLVFVQCDTQQDSFIVALDARTGETVWKADRDELPSWSTPTVYEGSTGPELITNAANFIRAYDPRTGQELWRLGGSSKITAPTPVFVDELIVVASGRHPERPIFVVRAGARGNITLQDGLESNESVVWSRQGRGPYMPTPLIYRGILYVLGNNGVLDAYDLVAGEELYRARVPHRGSGFSASPVAADGKIYLSNEDGDVVIVRAGPKFEHIATNTMGELLMATPALSEGVMYVRTSGSLFAIGS